MVLGFGDLQDRLNQLFGGSQLAFHQVQPFELNIGLHSYFPLGFFPAKRIIRASRHIRHLQVKVRRFLGFPAQMAGFL